MKLTRVALVMLVAIVAACGGGGGAPSGSTVGYVPSPAPGASLSPQAVNVSVSIPLAAAQHRTRAYLSPNTQSLVLQLTSVNGVAIPSQQSTTIDTFAGAPNCAPAGSSLVCTGTVTGANGSDVFSVTAYAQPNGTGGVLSSGSFAAQIGTTSSTLSINNAVSLTLSGVITSLSLTASPSTLLIGSPSSANVVVNATDASGAVIVGPGAYTSPISLTFTNGTSDFGFVTASNPSPQSALALTAPTTSLAVAYDGNPSVAPGAISVQAQTQGPSGTLTSNATIAVLPATPVPTSTPPPGSVDIYVLNAGATGTGATVTEYASNGSGNVAPSRTLALSSSLYAAGFAVDSSGSVYVGYYDNATFTPDAGDEIDVYAPAASGNATPARRILTDPVSQTTLDPGVIWVDSSNRIITLVDTQLDNQGGLSAVGIYAAGANGAVAPTHAWNFDYTLGPYINGYNAGGQGYIGGLTMDAGENFYVAGALYNLNVVAGIFGASAAAGSGGVVPISRTIPSDSTTTLPSPPDLITGLALDGSGFVYDAQTTAPGGGGPGATVTGAINVFAPGATSGTTDTAPLRTISSAALNSTLPPSGTETRLPLAIFGSTIYVANQAQNTVLVFPTSASGSIAPSATISGSSTALNAPIGIAVATNGGTQHSGARVRPEKHPHP
ncbi:MAG: hypothetical protein JO322_11075 [Candidatus Eremiobacteraeota bacterium]|nr:hypothetical protein [Candidatus Eremiobacteraeota bacterium]